MKLNKELKINEEQRRKLNWDEEIYDMLVKEVEQAEEISAHIQGNKEWILSILHLHGIVQPKDIYNTYKKIWGDPI